LLRLDLDRRDDLDGVLVGVEPVLPRPEHLFEDAALARRHAGVQVEGPAGEELAPGLPLGPEKFDPMMTGFQTPVATRVRTNHHVERTNRRLWQFEKVRDAWRRRRIIVRLLVLAVVRWPHPCITEEQREDTEARKPHAR
jgi:hypothetical protein